MRVRSKWPIAALALALSAMLTPAAAHELKPAVLALKELSPGRFAVHWSPPVLRSGSTDARPAFPRHCAVESDTLVDCGSRGLVGTLRFPSESGGFARVSVDIDTLDEPPWLGVASGDPPELRLVDVPATAAMEQQLELAMVYAELGVEHILMGWDHLMFVAGLVLIVRTRRQLLATLTAFTVAHSITLGAATLKLIAVPVAPLELTIALSILLLAVEATRSETWTHRAPWSVAFAFGLLHGFGFASALGDVGLPSQHLPLALLTFNVGVEAGQLLAVAAFALVGRVCSRIPRARSAAERVLVLVLGGVAVYWCLERGLALWRTWA